MSYMPDMLTVELIVKSVGRKALANQLGVGETAVHNAEAEGLFPASWRDVIETFCKTDGIDISSREFKCLFKMRGRAA